MGYDSPLRLLGVNFAFFVYIGFIFLISASVMLSLPPSEPGVVNVNSTSLTEINFHYSNTTDPHNFTLISSYNFSNITKSEGENNLINNSSSSVNEGIKKLNSGIFGNGIGIIAVALALIGLGISSYDKIQTSRMEEEILLRQQKKEYLLKKYKPSLIPVQIKALGMIWILGAVVIDFILGLSIGYFNFLPFLSAISLMFSGVLIEIFGLILLLYAILKSKEHPLELEPYTFDELIQKINDESRLK
ncbi:MAG: hypothetical protein ABSB80_12805 [Methanoregula sp.]|jgi:hypothetical protein|uniref:hypothetical protein n=1 Tax=Methanoregula sp. TaxID=2052170 RepID=UPI003D0FBA7B